MSDYRCLKCGSIWHVNDGEKKSLMYKHCSKCINQPVSHQMHGNSTPLRSNKKRKSNELSRSPSPVSKHKRHKSSCEYDENSVKVLYWNLQYHLQHMFLSQEFIRRISRSENFILNSISQIGYTLYRRLNFYEENYGQSLNARRSSGISIPDIVILGEFFMNEQNIAHINLILSNVRTFGYNWTYIPRRINRLEGILIGTRSDWNKNLTTSIPSNYRTNSDNPREGAFVDLKRDNKLKLRIGADHIPNNPAPFQRSDVLMSSYSMFWSSILGHFSYVYFFFKFHRTPIIKF